MQARGKKMKFYKANGEMGAAQNSRKDKMIIRIKYKICSRQ